MSALPTRAITLLQMQIVINNIINIFLQSIKNCTVTWGYGVTALKVGSESWWQSKHGPEWQRLNDEMFEVTFWWRDPQGSEGHSTIKRVWSISLA